MVSVLVMILLSVFVVSLISFVGALAMMVRQKVLNNVMFLVTAFAAGTLLGAAFLDMLPEALEAAEEIGTEPLTVLAFTLLGVLMFYSIERFIHWHHHHHRESKSDPGSSHKEVHAFTYLNLIGDGVHNFIDGVVIAASFITNVPLGIATTIAIALHEIPQELGDFGLLIYGGLKPAKALFFNFLSALMAVAGAIAGFVFLDKLGTPTMLLLAFAAGGFVYIASADLLPEFHKETEVWKSITQFAFIVTGVVLIFVLIRLFE